MKEYNEEKKPEDFYTPERKKAFIQKYKGKIMNYRGYRVKLISKDFAVDIDDPSDLRTYFTINQLIKEDLEKVGLWKKNF